LQPRVLIGSLKYLYVAIPQLFAGVSIAQPNAECGDYRRYESYGLSIGSE